MKAYCPSPHPNHRLLLATPPDSIDDGDITLATISRFDEQFLRTSQVSAQIDGSRLKILHLQGAGPLPSYKRAGVQPKSLFQQFQKDVGLRPINTLLAALALEAKDQDFEELVWTGSDRFHLQPKAILCATQFREDTQGTLRLPLDTSADKITRRLTGKCPKKQTTLETVRESFQTLFNRISAGHGKFLELRSKSYP